MMMKRFGWMALFLALTASARAEDAKIVLVAGRPSHGPGDHEFNAGTKLLVDCLKEIPGIDPVFVAGGWPADEKVFEGARSVVFYMDGGKGHPIIQGDHLATIQKLMDKGVGFVAMHYAVEVPKDRGGPEYLRWLGGYYEDRFSTNPHWTAEVVALPEHAITRGVKPFAVKDEWYYNLRFIPKGEGPAITPIVIAKPDDETRKGTSSSPRGPYPHIVADKGREEILAWAFDRPDGGRSFGFTGGHSHKNWGNDDFRTLVLNAIAWTAKFEVPSQGFKIPVSAEKLAQNLDPKAKK